MGSRLIKLILILFPSILFSQSEGGFGFRRFANTANLTATSVNNSDKSASRRGYVHSTGLYYRWNGSAWVIEETIDTFSVSGNTLSLSILNDGIPAKTVDLGINIQCDNIISPASFSTNQDNFNPTGLTGACEVRLTTTAQVNLTGIEAQVDGYELILTNEGNHSITLTNDATSTAANRFLIGYNYNLGSKQSVKIRYDGTASRWRVVDNLSLGSGSGRIAGGRSQNVYWSYQTDTLNDFALGYFTNGTSDDKSTFGKFGFHIDGDGGFGIGGKETYIKGSNFDLLKTSYVSARESNFDLAAYSRTSVGATASIGQLAGIPSVIYFYNRVVGSAYYDLGVTVKKDWSGVPSNKKDYGALVQTGEYNGAAGDTSTISVWWGLPQITDTTGQMDIQNGIVAVSKERGFGVQSLFDSGSGNFAITPFNWLKIVTGNVASDTAIHSTTNDGITFYGNKWEIPNETPSSAAGDSSVILWTSRFNSFFIDIDDIKGSSVNIYNADGTQDDATRYFTQDSTRTFAMGQFTSVSTPTWGRGYYYDPSTSNGVRLLNKNGANTTTSKVELDPETLTLGTTHTTSNSTTTLLSINESASFESIINRTSDTYGTLDIVSFTNSNEEILALKQTGKGTAQTVSMYLGDGYASSQYARYTSRAWGLETLLSSGGYDWIQVLLPDTGTDTTGNNLNFYNRAYYWSNEFPSSTLNDTMVHVWIGNGTTTTPDFVEIEDIIASAKNLYNSNGTTTQNTRTATILESLQWVGSADLGVDPYPFQIHSTGNEPLIQLWKGNTDSVWLYQSDVEYHFGSSAQLVVESNDELTLNADSIQASTIETKTKIRNLLGVTSGGWIKKFDGNDELAGAFIVSNGTDWIPGTDLLGGGAAIFGTSTLVGGTVTINTTSALTNSVIIISRNTAGGTVGDLRLGAITNGTSFVINSASGTDTSTVNWWILN